VCIDLLCWPPALDTHLGAWKNRDVVLVGVALKMFVIKMKKLRFDSSRRGMIRGDFWRGGIVLKKEAWVHEEWATAGSELVVDLVEAATLLI